jgi:hypothetical protein
MGAPATCAAFRRLSAPAVPGLGCACAFTLPRRPWQPEQVATFTVRASWISDAVVADDAVLNVNRSFRPEDENLCTWVDQAEPRHFHVSFSVESEAYATAVRECLSAVAAVPQIEPRVGTLKEVGAMDEEGGVVVPASDLEELLPED